MKYLRWIALALVLALLGSCVLCSCDDIGEGESSEEETTRSNTAELWGEDDEEEIPEEEEATVRQDDDADAVDPDASASDEPTNEPTDASSDTSWDSATPEDLLNSEVSPEEWEDVLAAPNFENVTVYYEYTQGGIFTSR